MQRNRYKYSNKSDSNINISCSRRKSIVYNACENHFSHSCDLWHSPTARANKLHTRVKSAIFNTCCTIYIYYSICGVGKGLHSQGLNFN